MNRPYLKGMSAYREVDIHTRSVQPDQFELVVLMFEGILESVNRATGAIQRADTATKIAEINRAVRILQEGLRTSLDLDHGGELAANLANLYDYCVMRLTQANASNNPDMLEEVVNLLKPVADAWKQMRAGAAAGSEAAPRAAEPKATPVMPTKAPPVARRVGSAYGQNMAWAGA